MTEIPAWQSRTLVELAQASHARETGNEGMARVCARRAAGVVIREFLQRQSIPPPATSAYQLLRYLSHDEGVSREVRQVAHRFTLPINFDHELPVKTDLIADVLWLAEALLGVTLPFDAPNPPLNT